MAKMAKGDAQQKKKSKKGKQAQPGTEMPPPTRAGILDQLPLELALEVSELFCRSPVETSASPDNAPQVLSQCEYDDLMALSLSCLHWWTFFSTDPRGIATLGRVRRRLRNHDKAIKKEQACAWMLRSFLVSTETQSYNGLGGYSRARDLEEARVAAARLQADQQKAQSAAREAKRAAALKVKKPIQGPGKKAAESTRPAAAAAPPVDPCIESFVAQPGRLEHLRAAVDIVTGDKSITLEQATQAVSIELGKLPAGTLDDSGSSFDLIGTFGADAFVLDSYVKELFPEASGATIASATTIPLVALFAACPLPGTTDQLLDRDALGSWRKNRNTAAAMHALFEELQHLIPGTKVILGVSEVGSLPRDVLFPFELTILQLSTGLLATLRRPAEAQTLRA